MNINGTTQEQAGCALLNRQRWAVLYFTPLAMASRVVHFSSTAAVFRPVLTSPLLRLCFVRAVTQWTCFLLDPVSGHRAWRCDDWLQPACAHARKKTTTRLVRTLVQQHCDDVFFLNVPIWTIVMPSDSDAVLGTSWKVRVLLVRCLEAARFGSSGNWSRVKCFWRCVDYNLQLLCIRAYPHVFVPTGMH